MVGNGSAAQHPASGVLCNSSTSCVWYHNKKPRFYDEIKLQLPPLLTGKHHILVTFYHVQCNMKKKSSSSSSNSEDSTQVGNNLSWSDLPTNIVVAKFMLFLFADCFGLQLHSLI